VAVSPRTMHVPAGLPLDEATRPELLDVGTANVANRNVRNNERAALEKRLGFAALSSDLLLGGERTTGRRIFAHGTDDVPCVIDGTHLDVYSENAEEWVRIGRVPECSYRLRDLPTPSSSAAISDTEYVGGYLAVAATASSPAYSTVAIVDLASGVAVRPHEEVGALAGPVTLASYGSKLVAFVYDEASTIIAYILDVTDLAAGWSTLATITTDTAANVYPSVCSLTNRVAIVYAATPTSGGGSGDDRVIVSTLDATGILETATIDTSAADPSDLDIDAADVLWVTWAIESSVDSAFACALSTTTLATTIGTTIGVEDFATCANLRICAGTTAQTARVFVHDTASGGNLDIADLTIAAGAVVATPGTRVYNALPVSRPFCRENRYYMAVAPSPSSTGSTGNAAQALCVLVDWTENDGTLRPIANVEPGLVPGVARFAKISDIGNGRYALALQRLKSGSGNVFALAAGLGTVGLCLAELDFVSRDRWQTASLGGVTVLGGGVLSTFDGSRVAESGFLARPQAPVADVSSGTGLTAATGFRYVAIYEDVDAAGNWSVSGISDPSTSTGAFTNKVSTVSVPPLTVTSRIVDGEPGTVRVAFYRTTDGGEPPYYRLGATVVDPASSSLTFADTTSDATLTTRAKLYAPQLPGTVGESLDRRAAAGLKHVTAYADMIVGAKGSSLVYSGQQVYGEATWFSPVFELPITSGGDITGIAAQDGALIVFKSDRIFLVSGESPSDNGAAGGISASRLVASDVGCISADSIVPTSFGVFFQSGRGIELFTRSQTVEWIGESVQDTLAAYPVVTSAVVDERNSLVRFTLARSIEVDGQVTGPNGDDETDIAGRDAIFDLTLRSWISVDDRVTRDAAQHAAYCDGRYSWLNTAGVVRVETDECKDDGEWVPSSFTLPPWKLGLQQDQRIWEMQLLYESRSSAGITIEVAEDFGSFGATTADKVWTAAQIAASSAPAVPFCPRDHGFAVQLRVTDTAPTGDLGTGRGFTWIGFSADIAQKSGQYRGMPRLAEGIRR